MFIGGCKVNYIPMFRGFMYMFAIIDVYSRKIMGWSISNTMNVEWCKEVLQNTIKEHGKPAIFVSALPSTSFIRFG